jgi:CO/xanthine dehydrogenase FAD-binding subunit
MLKKWDKRGEIKMLHLKEYISPASLEEAYTLNQKKNNKILGGMGWLKMQDRNIGTGIDLSKLGLDTIEETEEEFRIGAMVTLRQLETHPGIDALTQGAVKESLRHIVGVQFRNCATIGGSIWGRFGFSDPLTCLLALNASVELYQGGIVPLSEFIHRPADRDILVRVILPKENVPVVYTSFRNTATDFPVLAVCVAKSETGYRCAVGARPERAALVEGANEAELKEKAAALPYGSNTRGSEEYRRHLSGVLIGRCMKKLEVEA